MTASLSRADRPAVPVHGTKGPHMSTPPLVFMDTETTGLSLADDIWEFAAIRREGDGTPDYPLHLFIEHDADKAATLPESFRRDLEARFDPAVAISPRDAARLIAHVLRPGDGGKAHVVGAVPNFDTERVALLLAAYGLAPCWHYHLIDVENIAAGFILGRSRSATPLPWDSDHLSRMVGVEPPTDGRHTAMGDAMWARDIYDRLLDSNPEGACDR